MRHLLYVWRENRDLDAAPAAIQKQLEAGDDVDGLADLPVKEMIDRLKREFPGMKESAGLLSWQSGEERIEITWTWQYLRVASENLNAEHRDKFFELARSFHCPVYDPQMNLKMKA